MLDEQIIVFNEKNLDIIKMKQMLIYFVAVLISKIYCTIASVSAKKFAGSSISVNKPGTEEENESIMIHYGMRGSN